MSIRGQRRSFGKGTTKASAPYKPLRDNKKLPVYIRLADDGDASFVYKSWLDSWWVQNKDQFQPLFYKGHRQVIKRLMENAITVIACSDDDPNLIFAWMCGLRTHNNRLIVHYAYTKEAFRSFGLARTLLRYFEHRKGEPILCSHRSFIFKELKQPYNLFYVPGLQQPDGVSKIESEEWKL